MRFFSLPSASILCAIFSLWLSQISADEYTVKAGDTLIGIAKQHIKRAQNENPMSIQAFVNQVVNDNPTKFINANPDHLSPGVKLQIPDLRPLIQPEPVEVVADIPATTIKTTAVIGHVSKLSGQGWLLHTDETRQQLYVGLGVKQGDNILTNLQSRAQIEFIDGSNISLKQQSQIKISEYHWNQQDNSGRSIFNFLKGAFRAVSGLIAKNNQIDYSVITPVATIGVRGTNFGARLCNQEICELQSKDNNITISKGIYIGVLQGQIVAQSGEQQTQVKQGEAIYQKDALSQAKKVSNIPGLIFSAEELETYLPVQKKKKIEKTLKKTELPKKKEPFYGAFWLNSSGNVVKDGQGNCIRNGNYRKDHHVAECS